MSQMHQDISYILIDAIFQGLTGSGVTYNFVTYPVYKSIPKLPPSIYVFVGNVIQTEDGTKDEFMYEGTVQIHVVDESKERADLMLAQAIISVTRFLLKIQRTRIFTLEAWGPDSTARKLVILKPDTFNTVVSQAANGIVAIRLVDTYNFLIN